MRLDYTLTYMSCGQCSERTHCEECQERLAQIIGGFRGVRHAVLNIPAKRMTIEADDATDEDDLIDDMEGIGILAD